MDYSNLVISLVLSAIIALIVSIAFHFITTLIIRSWFDQFFNTQQQINKNFVETIKEDIKNKLHSR